MKKVLYFFAGWAILFFTACDSDKEKSDQVSIYNKVASLDSLVGIGTINIKRLFDKSNLFETKLLPPSVKPMAKMYKTKYMGDSNSMGIDWDQNITVAAFGSSLGEAKMVGMIRYDNQEKLEKFLENEMKVKIKEEQGIAVATIDPTTTLGWHDNVLAAYFTPVTKADQNPGKILSNVLKAEAPEEIDENMRSFITKKEKDISILTFFKFSGDSMHGMDKETGEVMQKVSQDMNLEDIYSTIELNFLKGNIRLKSHIYNFNADDLPFESAHPDGVDKQLAAVVSPDGKAMVGSLMAYNLKSIGEYFMEVIPQEALDGINKELSAYYGFNMEQLLKTFTGQGAFSMEKFPEDDSYNMEDDELVKTKGDLGNFAVALNLADTSYLKDVMEKHKDKIEQKDGYYFTVIGNDTLFYYYNDKYLVATSNADVVQYNMNGKLQSYKDEGLLSMGDDNLVTFKLDGSQFNKTSLIQEDKSSQIAFSDVKEITFSQNLKEFQLDILFKDDTENSLHKILKISSKMKKYLQKPEEEPKVHTEKPSA